MAIKYVAYAGWFDDGRCSNFYVSSITSDRIEDIAYKVMYLIFGIVLAILIRVNPVRSNSLYTLLFVMGLPFVIFLIHWVSIRAMYIGCTSGLFDNDCAISPATFYREYIFGQSSEDLDTASNLSHDEKSYYAISEKSPRHLYHVIGMDRFRDSAPPQLAHDDRCRTKGRK